jgi:large subunit ribosomal protein L13
VVTLSVAAQLPRSLARELGGPDDDKDSHVRTYSPKAAELSRSWHVLDADGLVLGRLCTEVARLLRGKHKVTFAPHLDTGDAVIIINAEKIRLTANKADDKRAYRHSGYPGGLRSTSYADLLETRPTELVTRAVRGMIPHTRLGRVQMKHLFVYAGPEHPHAAQQPTAYDTSALRRS